MVRVSHRKSLAFIDNESLLQQFILVEKRTEIPSGTEPLIAQLRFIVFLVVLEFFPPVTKTTIRSLGTAFVIVHNFPLYIPANTLYCFLRGKKGSLEVLPVVCVDAPVFVVARLGIGAEFGLV